MIKRKLFRRPPVPKNSLEDTHLVYQTKKSSLDDSDSQHQDDCDVLKKKVQVLPPIKKCKGPTSPNKSQSSQKYGPKIYKPEKFPIRKPKSLSELHRGFVNSKWNEFSNLIKFKNEAEVGEKLTPPSNETAVTRPKSQGDQPLAKLECEAIPEYSEDVTDESTDDLQDFIPNQETFKSVLLENRARTATPPLTCGNPEDPDYESVSRVNIHMQLQGSVHDQCSSEQVGLRNSKKSAGGEKKIVDANRVFQNSPLQPKELTVTNVDLNIEGKNVPKRRTFKQIVTLTQDLNYLIQRKYKMPKHMIIIGVKKLLRNSLEKHNIKSPDMIFSSGVMDEVLRDIDNLAYVHRISHKERIKAVIAATEDHFNYLASVEAQQAENSTLTSQLSKDSALSKAQLEVVASFIAGGEVLSLKGHFLTELPETKPIWKTLIYLDLSYNSFKILPEEVVRFEKLQYLKLRNNPLIQLPVQINKYIFYCSFCIS